LGVIVERDNTVCLVVAGETLPKVGSIIGGGVSDHESLEVALRRRGRALGQVQVDLLGKLGNLRIDDCKPSNAKGNTQ
jgi:hypothetical protein